MTAQKRHFSLHYLLLFAFMGILLNSSTVFAAKNLIKNGTASRGLDDWTQASGAWVTNDTEVSPVSGYFFAAGECEKGELYQDVSLQDIPAGTVLKLSAQCRDYNGNDICVLKMAFRNKNGKTLSYAQTEYSRDVWKKVKTVGLVPDSAVTVRVSLIGIRKSGAYNDAYFDNVVLNTAALYKTNVLNNGSGEYGISGWKDSDNAWGNSTYNTDHTPKDGAAFLWPCRKQLAKSKIYQDVRIPESLTGEWVTLSAWLANYDQAPHDQAVLKISFLNKRGKAVSSASQSQRNPAWQKHVITKKVPSGTAKIRVTLSGTRFVGQDLDCYFDDVRLFFPGKKYKSVSVSWAECGSIVVGGKGTLTAKYKDTTSASSFTWTSSYDAVAKVNSKGVVSFVSPGAVTIYATHKSSKVTGSISFTVEEKKDSDVWMERMEQFRNDPRWGTNGKSWGDTKTPELSNYGSAGCMAYVNDFVAYVYGRRNEKSDKVTRIDSISEEKKKDTDIRNIRAGDIVSYKNPHYFVVISIDQETGKMYTMEGNASDKVRVGDNYYRIKDGKLQINWPRNKKNNWSTREFKWIKHFDDYKS